MLKSFTRLSLLTLLLAWIFDQLFWNKLPGISFPIFVGMALLIGFFLAWREDVRPAKTGFLLLVPIVFFAVMSFLRLEPFTQFLNYTLTLGLMTLLTVTFSGGRWIAYGMVDYFVNLLFLIPSLLVLPLITMDRSQKAAKSDDPPQPAAVRWRPLVGVLRGLLLALPVVVIFTALLAAADAAFSAEVTNLLKIFDLDKVPEYIFRLFYIGILAYLLASIFLHALLRSGEEKLIDLTARSGGKLRFLPHLEATVVLGCVNALFAAFVAVQLRYFFGGQANINVAGFTYAEYARRGFNELLIVAFFSLLLFWALSTFTQRDSPGQRWSFSALGTGLVLLVTVILISAFQRLTMYEQVYGFTRLRTYTHIFMFWLGLLLLIVIALEWFGRMRHFALTAVLVALAFAASLNLLKVDALIVHLNVAHSTTFMDPPPIPFGATRQVELDTTYLSTLTPDAVPALVDAFHQADLVPATHDELGAALACKAAQVSDQDALSWLSFNWSRYTAQQLLQDEQDALNAYPVTYERGRYWVRVNGRQRSCFEYAWDLD